MSAPLRDTTGPKVLIVDDVPASLDLLYRTLSPKATRSWPRRTVTPRSRRPSQSQTCNEATHAIPVIFITAQHETASVVESIRAGGVDYISKPFQAEEVLARVETHLKISRYARTGRPKSGAPSGDRAPAKGRGRVADGARTALAAVRTRSRALGFGTFLSLVNA
jgi:hypothetical protein